MKLYGIKTCSTVGKARKHLNECGIDFEFINYRETPVSESKILEWANIVGIDIIFNKKGKKFRDLGLKDLQLSDEDKISWLAKENTLLKRPILEYADGKILVGFKEDIYNIHLKLS